MSKSRTLLHAMFKVLPTRSHGTKAGMDKLIDGSERASWWTSSWTNGRGM